MTLLQKDYYLIPGNGVNKLLRLNCMMRLVYAKLLVLPHNNFSILGNDAKNLLKPIFIYMERCISSFFYEMIHLKFVFVVLITASAQVVQVIKVDI